MGRKRLRSKGPASVTKKARRNIEVKAEVTWPVKSEESSEKDNGKTKDCATAGNGGFINLGSAVEDFKMTPFVLLKDIVLEEEACEAEEPQTPSFNNLKKEYEEEEPLVEEPQIISLMDVKEEFVEEQQEEEEFETGEPLENLHEGPEEEEDPADEEEFSGGSSDDTDEDSDDQDSEGINDRVMDGHNSSENLIEEEDDLKEPPSRSARPQAKSTHRWVKKSNGRSLHAFGGRKEVKSRVVIRDSSPLNCFMQFFTDDIMKFILEMSNKHADENKGTNPKHSEIGEDELKAYFGLIIMMGIVRLPNMGMYWQKKEWILDYSAPNRIISRPRFLFISRHLNFCDESQAPKDPSRDRMYKIQPFLNRIVPTFENAYSPGREISIAVTLIPFNGRIKFRHFIPAKRTRYGLKAIVLTESNTGYVSRLHFHIGSLGRKVVDVTLATNAVQTLIQPYVNLWHRLYVDDFFTNPDLFEYLMKNGTYACGIICPTTKGFPKELLVKKITKVKHGYSDWRMCRELLAQSWVDNCGLYCMSTFHLPKYDSTYKGATTVKRKGYRHASGPFEISCPPMIHDYKVHTGGVDQMKKYFKFARRTRRWHQKVFTYIMEIAIHNAQVLSEQARGKKWDPITFRVELAKSLVSRAESSRNYYLTNTDDIFLSQIDSQGPMWYARSKEQTQN